MIEGLCQPLNIRMKTVRLLHSKIHMPTVSDVLAGDDTLQMNFFYNEINRVFDYTVHRRHFFDIAHEDIIEVDISEFLALPRALRSRLLDRKLMITSAIDIHGAMKKLDGILGSWHNNVVYVTSNYSEKSTCCETYCVNPWPLFVMNTSQVSRCMLDNPSEWIDYVTREPRAKYFLPVFKARPHRLVLLDQFDQYGLLDQTVWSLGCDDSGNHTNMIQYLKMHIPDHLGRFINKYKKVLPKHLDIPSEKYSDLVFLNESWVGEFEHIIAAETQLDQLFLTEKTYRAFALGGTPWVFGHPDSHHRLRREGFEVPKFEPSGTVEEQACQLIACMQSQSLSKEQRLHNFDLIANREWLKSQILDGYEAAIRKLRTEQS